MPELPEVETTVRGLAKVLDGRRIESIELRRSDLRRPFPVDLRQRMTGARVTGLGRRAKYGLIDTDRGDTFVFHLGMSGSWRVDPSEIGTHDHVVIETDEGRRLSLNDPRRFGSIDLVPTERLESSEPFSRMGPEPLSDDFDGAYLAEALAGRQAPIKAMLLDQRVVAGLGNIYVCEALHMARIAPTRAAGRISGPRPIGAARGDRRRRLNPARLCAAQWRARLLLGQMAGLWTRGKGLPGLRRQGPPPHRFGPLDLLLPELPARLTRSGRIPRWRA